MRYTNYPKGSEWRKWDLHVHTPSSYDYENKSITNDEFINSLLEENISVVAIIDHHFIDVERIFKLKEIAMGKITILPGIELRSELGGRESIHFIGIFSELLSKNELSDIWTKISGQLNLTKTDINKLGDDRVFTDLKEASKLIRELGGIVTVHAGTKTNSIENIKSIFERFKDYLKEDLVKNFIDILEIGKKEDEHDYQQVVFPAIKTKLPLILASDNHNIKNYKNCRFTWIKADPTFEGLKQIIYEPEDRVSFDEPELLKRVHENKTKFIKSLKIDQIPGYDEKQGIWFKDITIPFNSGLVAIIGNRGSGKSAIVDILGLCGNSHQYNDFSFLRKDRFLNKGLARNFEASLEWFDGSVIKKNLFEESDLSSPERVRYLPQSFFEKLTNEIEEREFPKTLENIVFSYLPDEQKLGKSSFQELIKFKQETVEKEIKLILEEIDKLNEEIIDFEKKQHPDYRKKLEEKLRLRKKELEEHEKNKPEAVKNPAEDTAISEEQKKYYEELSQLKEKIKEIEGKIYKNKETLNNLMLEREELEQLSKNLKLEKQRIEKFKDENKQKFEKFGLKIDEIINIKIDTRKLKQIVEEKNQQIKNIQELLFSDNEIEKIEEKERDRLKKKSLIIKKNEINAQIQKINERLSDPEKRYQEYLEKIKKWEMEKNAILGSEAKIDTIKWLEKQIKFIDSELNNKLNKLREERIEKSIKIYEKKNELVEIYTQFKKAVDDKITSHREILSDYEIIIEAALNINKGFINKFLSFVNQKLKGSFYGKEEGEVLLKDKLNNIDVNSKKDLIKFLKDIIKLFEIDHREAFKEKSEEEKRRYVFEQVKELKDFYNYLFSLEYIEPIYELKLGSKSISQLSPGEKGALLIVFYLMLDKDNIPLIIDQPEENLDNESIYKILTKFIRLAKQRRQLIMVTHNPNLAIVGDAEQIIFVSIDKKNGNKFSFESGSIENPIINKHASDILEGTLKAFDVRRLKYFRS